MFSAVIFAISLLVTLVLPPATATADHGSRADCAPTDAHGGRFCSPDGSWGVTLYNPYKPGTRRYDGTVTWGDGTSVTVMDWQDTQTVNHQYTAHGVFTVTTQLDGTPLQEGASCSLAGTSTSTVEVPAPSGTPVESCTLNLRLFDGQGGNLPSDAAEQSRGAFTVFNGNDSDADGEADFRQHPVPGEGDLMRLHLLAPKPDSGGEVSLRAVSSQRKIAIYEQANKRGRLAHDPELRIPTSRLPLTLWVEGRRRSDDVRDISLRYEYDPPGAAPVCSDVADATVVWAETAGVRSERLERMWADLPDPPRTGFDRTCGGLGLRPPAAKPRGVRNCIAFRFEVQPPAVRNEPDVIFDVTRQRRSDFLVVATTTGRELQKDQSRFPPGDDANDDTHDRDETQVPDANGRLYSYDGPGLADAANPYRVGVRVRYDGRFREYVRVAFDGVRPTGNGASGTRASPKVLWAARHTLRSNAGALERTTGDRRDTDENFVKRR